MVNLKNANTARAPSWLPSAEQVSVAVILQICIKIVGWWCTVTVIFHIFPYSLQANAGIVFSKKRWQRPSKSPFLLTIHDNLSTAFISMWHLQLKVLLKTLQLSYAQIIFLPTFSDSHMTNITWQPANEVPDACLRDPVWILATTSFSDWCDFFPPFHSIVRIWL